MTSASGNAPNRAATQRTASRQYDGATPEPKRDSGASYADDAPPQNIEAERAVLGAILLNPADTVAKVAETLAGSGPEAFYAEAHRLIYAAILALFEAHAPIDEITVTDQLRRTGNLERAGGISYIAGLTLAVQTSANAEHYAGIVLDAHRRRVLEHSAQVLARIAGDAGTPLEEVRTVMADLEFPDSVRGAVTPGADGLRQTLYRIKSGQHRNIPWPGWPQLTRMTRALLPGSATVLCGTPGATKSFLILQCVAAWNDDGVPACVCELEESREYHLHRALAQRAGDAHLLDDEWVREHPHDVDAAMALHEPWLRALARNIYLKPRTHPTLNEMAGWVASRCRDGYRVIVLDPISMANQGEHPASDAARLMDRVKDVASKFGASVVMVSHLVKNAQTRKMDDIAGGAAYSRQANCCMVLEAHEMRLSDAVGKDGGRHEVSTNRTLHLVKTRDSVGVGERLAFFYDHSTLQLSECGVLQFDNKPQRGEGRTPRTTTATRAPRTPRPQQPALVPETDPFDDGEETF